MAGPIFCPSPALAGYAMSWMCIGWYPVEADRLLHLCSVCVCVVQLNCVRVQVKVQCMAYCKVGVCCRVY